MWAAALISGTAWGQIVGVKRPPLLWGASLGVGGVHTYVKPSFDLHWRGASLRLAPGLFYLSAGLTQELSRRRNVRLPYLRERPVIASVYYHYGWLLNDILRKQPADVPQTRAVHLGMAMVGFKFKMDRLYSIFMEAQIGVMWRHETLYPFEGEIVKPRNNFWPMGEFRISGIPRFHKHRKQRYHRDVSK